MADNDIDLSSKSNILKTALDYANVGLSVFPVHSIDSSGQCTCRDMNCENPGKHPKTLHGVLDATNDNDQITKWGNTWDDSNIGVATGSKSGIIVVDIDKKSVDGLATLEQFEVTNGKLPPTVVVHSGGDGKHFYFKHPGIPIRSRTAVAPGLDIRAEGAYIIVPPSRHKSGKEYTFAPDSPVFDQNKLANLPNWLLGLLSKENTGNRKFQSIGQEIPEGERNVVLASIAGSLRRKGLEMEEIEAALLSVNARRCTRPLPNKEISAIAQSISRYPINGDIISLNSFNSYSLSPSTRLNSSNSFISYGASERAWPVLDKKAALYGLPGRIVCAIEPHTEADPVALLIQLLVAFGNIIGRKAYFVAEESFHYMNLFAVLIGQTAKGRKGSSWSRIRALFSDSQAEWLKDHVLSGLSSGEGVIYHVRDPIMKEKNVIDPGITDKRILVLEAEFASTLRVMEREGSTLSAVIRHLWDDGNISTLTKNNPVKATGAHASIVGHVTAEELRRRLNETEAGNGFANRFLWVCVCRSKSLPEGGKVKRELLLPLIEQLSEAVNFASQVDEMNRDNEAREYWREIYDDLSEGKPGLFGALVSRAEPQVMRLACIYALLDLSSIVRLEHLKAGLALWKYTEDSVKYVFGDSFGDPVADSILTALRASSEGLTRTNINNLFGRNVPSNQIDRALNLIRRQKLAHFELQEPSGRFGRPSHLWRALTK